MKTLVIKGDIFTCIKDFYSLSGELIFRAGIRYEANNDRCIISGMYNLHVDETFFNYFLLAKRHL